LELLFGRFGAQLLADESLAASAGSWLPLLLLIDAEVKGLAERVSVRPAGSRLELTEVDGCGNKTDEQLVL
jgi:hypothetical protein